MRMLIRNSLIVLSATLVLVGCHKEKKEKPAAAKLVKTMVVQKPQSFIQRSFAGKVFATREATLSFKVPGKIVKLPILEGMEIRQGQLIAQLNEHDYKEKVRESEARYIHAKAEYGRAKSLVVDGHISRSEYDYKRSAYLVTIANYNTAKENLREATIKAPFTGNIANKFVENHEYIKAKQKIVKLQDLSVLDIEFSVPENVMINLRKEGDKVKIYAVFPAAPKNEFEVTYKEMSTEADPETQTYQIKVKLPAPRKINILPGMTATIITKLPNTKTKNQDFLLVPSSAIFTDKKNQASVWLVNEKNNTIKRVSITVRRLSGSNAEITKGLKPGDRVVSAGVHFLQPGEKIQLLKPAKGNAK